MINNFDKETADLNHYEMSVVIPKMVIGLKTKVGKSKAITNSEMIKGLEGIGIKINSARVRKCIRYIRVGGLVERLIATSKGYYISDDPKELDDYVESLHQRADSISLLAKQLEYQSKKLHG